MIGMAMSIRITSGSTEIASWTASAPSPAWPTTSMPVVRREDRLEGFREQAVVVRDQHA